MWCRGTFWGCTAVDKVCRSRTGAEEMEVRVAVAEGRSAPRGTSRGGEVCLINVAGQEVLHCRGSRRPVLRRRRCRRRGWRCQRWPAPRLSSFKQLGRVPFKLRERVLVKRAGRSKLPKLRRLTRGGQGGAEIATEKGKRAVCPFLEERSGKSVVQADDACGVKSLHAVETREERALETGDVAAACSRAPVVEQLVWDDASESLPGADPEEVGPSGPAYGDYDAALNRSPASPTGSLEGPASAAPATMGSVEGARDPLRPDEYVCISVSNLVHHMVPRETRWRLVWGSRWSLLRQDQLGPATRVTAA
jgi:hypothetical protein